MWLIDLWQALAFEATAHLGPEASAVLSGFAVLIGTELRLTDAGERYLASQREET